jgi:nucleoside-diphosphate-sugar epimerase
MRLLVIGGTVFLGRAVVEEALARGHEVTVFHRGLHGRGVQPEAETLIGDRTSDLSALEGREWDAVIDTCGFEPEHVALTAGALADRVGHYGFVSSGSAYADWPDAAVDEDSPRFDGAEPEYGPLKAACERAAEAAMPGRVLVARAGVIVGPHENIGRLPRWLWRLAEGGEVLAPGPPDAPLQLIDARDLGGWMVDMAAAGRAGAYNAIAERGSATWGELLALAHAATGGGAELRWVGPEVVEAHVEEPWEMLPLWPIPSLPGLYGMSGAKAAAAGLTPRPLAETVADTWAWLSAGGELDDWRRELRVHGLSPEAERALLSRPTA